MIWYDDIKRMITDSCTLQLLPQYRTFSNLRNVSVNYLATLDSNKLIRPFIAAWHPSAPLIVIGKRYKNKTNANLSIKHHVVVTQTNDYLITIPCDGCQLTTLQFS